jgi:hypothetical protein
MTSGRRSQDGCTLHLELPESDTAPTDVSDVDLPTLKTARGRQGALRPSKHLPVAPARHTDIWKESCHARLIVFARSRGDYCSGPQRGRDRGRSHPVSRRLARQVDLLLDRRPIQQCPRTTPAQPFRPDLRGLPRGTFRGITAQLSYLKQLGVGTLWLSPVLANFRPTYHGYGIHDFISAEPRFAENPANADTELRELVDAAHAEGLYVIFDIVLNHVGDVFAYRCDPQDTSCQTSDGAQARFSTDTQPVEWRDSTGKPDLHLTSIEDITDPPRDAYVWLRELQHNAFFRRQGTPQPGGDDTVGDFQSLKQMRTDDPRLQDLLIKAYQYVIARSTSTVSASTPCAT